ncbi:MAG: ThuA domain-containing protein [Clostridiales bacterium]|nr:ThuA domain-containing protein [Clostridiales bacterium]
MRKALIVHGGWEGHQPVEVSKVFKEILEKNGFSVEVSDTLDAFKDYEKIKDLHLIVPIWTMGEIDKEYVKNISKAIGNGTGIAGCHGGMCDSFRVNTEWQFITGGQWVSHPGSDQVTYSVNVKNSSSPIIKDVFDFKVTSEQYYVHVDPCIEVLATTRFPSVNWYNSSNKEVDVPVVWTKKWGHGRVFYNSLGHHADVFDIKEVYKLMENGFIWAAEGKDIALENNFTYEDFENKGKMF